MFWTWAKRMADSVGDGIFERLRIVEAFVNSLPGNLPERRTGGIYMDLRGRGRGNV